MGGLAPPTRGTCATYVSMMLAWTAIVTKDFQSYTGYAWYQADLEFSRGPAPGQRPPAVPRPVQRVLAPSQRRVGGAPGVQGRQVLHLRMRSAGRRREAWASSSTTTLSGTSSRRGRRDEEAAHGDFGQVITDSAERGFAIHARRTAVRRSPACLCAVARMPTTCSRRSRGVNAWRDLLLSKGRAISFTRLFNEHASAHYICGRRGFAARGRLHSTPGKGRIYSA